MQRETRLIVAMHCYDQCPGSVLVPDWQYSAEKSQIQMIRIKIRLKSLGKTEEKQ